MCRRAYGHVYTKEAFMPLNIRDAEVDRLAKQLAALNHTTKTQAVQGRASTRTGARANEKVALGAHQTAAR